MSSAEFIQNTKDQAGNTSNIWRAEGELYTEVNSLKASAAGLTYILKVFTDGQEAIASQVSVFAETSYRTRSVYVDFSISASVFSYRPHNENLRKMHKLHSGSEDPHCVRYVFVGSFFLIKNGV